MQAPRRAVAAEYSLAQAVRAPVVVEAAGFVGTLNGAERTRVRQAVRGSGAPP